MRIGGYQKTSLIDYPGKVAAVVFTSGCNFRCPYCHNRDLVLFRPEDPVFNADDVLEDLKKRRKLLDGVVFTGGEPTLQKDLEGFAKKIKELDLLIKLDTNGSNSYFLSEAKDARFSSGVRGSSILSSLVKPASSALKKENGLVDFIALDIKSPLDHRYGESIGLENFDVSSILSSMKELAFSRIDYELRTTVVPGLHSEEDLLDLAHQLSEIAPGAKLILQNFQPKNCLDPEFEKIKPYDKMFLENLVEKLRVHMPNTSLR